VSDQWDGVESIRYTQYDFDWSSGGGVGGNGANEVSFIGAGFDDVGERSVVDGDIEFVGFISILVSGVLQ
jgi:hypothetical protein